MRRTSALRFRCTQCARDDTNLNGDIVALLEKRGLAAAVTSSKIRQHLASSSRAVYYGMDPSASSLHIGNLVGLVALLHFGLRGHRPIALIGGATGSVGDPSGRSSERKALSPAVLQANIDSITSQVTNLFERGVPFALRRSGNNATITSNQIQFLNNKEWIGKMSLLDFLSGPGKRARVSTMLSRESVRSRLNSASGISFTEFSYQLMQAYDFYHLHKTFDCSVQLGGSDQWGNIQSGIEMIRREALSEHQLAEDDHQSDQSSADATAPAYGFTYPLLTTASGEKFGKSAGNAVWLDEKLTSSFELYQFFLRTADEDVERYLKVFTFLPLEQIESAVKEHKASPDQRSGQRLLAAEVTEFLHGEQGLRKALAATAVTFSSSEFKEIRAEDIIAAFEGTPQIRHIQADSLLETSVLQISVDSGLLPSKCEDHRNQEGCKELTFAGKAQARQAIQSGGLSINGQKVTDASQVLQASDLLEGKVAVLRFGKNGLRILVVAN